MGRHSGPRVATSNLGRDKNAKYPATKLPVPFGSRLFEVDPAVPYDSKYYTWTVPQGVWSICIVAVGGGGAGYGYNGGCGGGGGALHWKNDIDVFPGQVLDITVGGGGEDVRKSPGLSSDFPMYAGSGLRSIVSSGRTTFVLANGGNAGVISVYGN